VNLSAISSIHLLPLFPKAAPKKVTLVDLLPKPPKDDISNLLSNIKKINDIYFLLRYGKAAFLENSSSQSGDLNYGNYLQFPNSRIKALAMSIVKPSDSDDVKALKLLRWMQNEKNIKYVSDLQNYHLDEFWALPVITLNKKSGDCEDGSFFLASLMLNAGVNPSRVRVYGGFVSAGTNASTGGHAWVAYKRQSDNKWVALDWCYFPIPDPVADRPTLAKDTKYLDDYFYVTAFGTVDTTYMNTIRDILHPFRVNEKSPQQLVSVTDVAKAVRIKIVRDIMPLLAKHEITLQPGSIVDMLDTAYVNTARDIQYPFVGYGVNPQQSGRYIDVRV